ncbi:hypothetical protein Tco_0749877 [Tanacetum coccineum]|uniref:Uncharacterized protein n=1 Tax=Tanacetum coccineum TaxID=301880 RepID=A0ABQ4Z125_9ASTR
MLRLQVMSDGVMEVFGIKLGNDLWQWILNFLGRGCYGDVSCSRVGLFGWKMLVENDVRKKVKALGANGDVSCSRVGVVWMEVVGGIIRERVVSRVVVGLVEKLALEAMEYDDQDDGMRKIICRFLVEVGSCKEWDQECSCLRDHSPPLGEELEKVNRMTQSLEELELGDEAFFPHA